MNFAKKVLMNNYWKKIEKRLVLLMLTGALVLISQLCIAQDFQNNYAQAANKFEGSDGKPQAFSAMEPLPEPPTEVVRKLDLFKLLANLPGNPRFKGQVSPETPLPSPAKIPEAPRVEPQLGREIQTKASGLVDVRTYGFTDAAIKKAIDTNQGKCTLHFSSGTWRIGSNFTVPERVAVKIDNGAMLSVAKGATFLINGPLVDCLWQIFDDQNTDLNKGVKLARHTVTNVRPEWWGLTSKGNPATNWKALTKALHCSTTGKAEIGVLFSPGVFAFNDTIQLTPYCHLKGQNYFSASGHEGTVLGLASATNKCFLEGNNISAPVIENLVINGGYNDADCIYIHGGHYGEIKNCYFETSGLGKTRFAIKMAPQNQMLVENCRILASNGIYGGNMDGWIRGCEIRGPGYTTDNVGIKAVEGPLVHDCIIYGFARGIDLGGQMLLYGNRIDQCNICINGEKENILSGMPYIVPTNPPYTVKVSPNDWAFKDYGVMRQKGNFTTSSLYLRRVAADPGPGQYTVKDVPYGGTYTFNQAEAGKQLWFNFGHGLKSGGAGGNAQIIANRISSAVVGIQASNGSPTIIGNIFTQFNCGGNGCAVYFRGSGGILAFNKFQNNDRNIYCDANKAPLECHDNQGIDRAMDSGTLSSPISGDLPEVYAGDLWEAQNSSPTNLTAIKSAAEGHKIDLIVDKNTTVQKYWPLSGLYLTSDNNKSFRSVSGNNYNFNHESTFNYFKTPANNEIMYFGDDNRFNSVLFYVQANTEAKSVTFNWEYATEWGWVPTAEHAQPWAPNTYYPTGSIVKPRSETLAVVYIAQNQGKSGLNEPNWKKLFWGGYDPMAYVVDGSLAWRPVYPLKVTNPDALKSGGTGKVEILFSLPPSICWVPVNPKKIISPNFPGGTKFWLRCRLSGVTGGANGGSNNINAIKKCNIRLTTDTFNPKQKSILNLVYHNHSWLELGRGLL
jgi:hypothetical protein